MPIDDDGDVCGGDYYNGILGDRITKQDCEALYRRLEEQDARRAKARRKDMGAQTDGVGWNQLGEESQQPLTSADASEEDDWARIVMETYPPGVQDLIKESLKSEARIARVHKEQLRGQTGQLLQHASQQGSATTTNLIASGCDSEPINKESKARNRLHHFKMKRVGVPEKAKQDASFNVAIRRCGDDGGGKRSRSVGRGVGVNSRGS